PVRLLADLDHDRRHGRDHNGGGHGLLRRVAGFSRACRPFRWPAVDGHARGICDRGAVADDPGGRLRRRDLHGHRRPGARPRADCLQLRRPATPTGLEGGGMSERNSLERMLGILAVFDEVHPEWTPEQLMRRLGYSRPTLYRYLKTLKEAGLVVSINQAAYTLGPKIVELDFLLRRADPLILQGQPFLEELAARHPGTAFLSRWYKDRVLCVTSVRS